MAEEGDVVMSNVEEGAASSSSAVAAAEPMDLPTALKEVLKKALIHGGLARGLRAVTKAIDKGTALLCILATDCDESSYTTLVTALCQDRNVPLLKTLTGPELGEWSGLGRLDKTGAPKKVIKCSAVVITHYGEESQAHQILQAHLKKN
eukprot:CAMPEP_0184656220 /NCGR_PEP_ID=MMETSP0308-20130426/15991_1 /TAXON_ID=38269 /ORGANISM="Gloeochaete witrockiana, Strain SAG 46.84" /LENGTH=148 /DNA_ID=CAMNT_0027093223 /DNA_START=26 /DNA_END=472 /DNA_ORIENTATION=+